MEKAVLAELRTVKPEAGWFTQAFCQDARYFHPDNGARIDAMRDRIEAMGLIPGGESVEAFAKVMRSDADIYARIIRDAKISLQ